MCDIGRFEYHWIESDDRLRRPLRRTEAGLQEPTTWHALLSELPDRLAAAGRSNPDGVRFLLSAHASHEEFFLFHRLTEELIGSNGPSAMTVSWRFTPKNQPPETTFKVPAADAPNVNGARMFNLAPGRSGDPQGPADVSALQADVAAGRVSALYVFDPGPDGSIGDTRWILEARTAGRLPLLVVQAVVLNDLSRAADFVLPGASYAEKEASYTNDQGRLQGTARAIPTPGEAQEDWQILVNLSAAFGVPFDYTSGADVRADIGKRFSAIPELAGITTLPFAHPVSAQHWLQASNPSERWKWDFMYQDVPPTKFGGMPFSTNFEGVIPPDGVIPLKEVK
jgi:predicted molibdopterin-dependent oxidoreductase YjgC